jgi:hypothetical protein
MKTLRTAPQILEHYSLHCATDDYMLKAMRHYARVKSDKAYELGYQTALKQLTK